MSSNVRLADFSSRWIAEPPADLNGYSFGTPTSTVIPVQLQAGPNQIEFGNSNNFAPNLDSITIAPQFTF